MKLKKKYEMYIHWNKRETDTKIDHFNSVQIPGKNVSVEGKERRSKYTNSMFLSYLRTTIIPKYAH